MFIIACFIVTGIILMTFWLGGPLGLFVNLPSLVIVLVPALIAPFIMQNKQIVAGAFMALFKSASLPQSYDGYKEVFKTIDKTAMLMGWFGVVSGAIAIASTVTPDTFQDVIGPALAVMALTLLYALIIKVFCYFAILRIISSNAAVS
jgi:hypothetical protein